MFFKEFFNGKQTDIKRKNTECFIMWILGTLLVPAIAPAQLLSVIVYIICGFVGIYLYIRTLHYRQLLILTGWQLGAILCRVSAFTLHIFYLYGQEADVAGDSAAPVQTLMLVLCIACYLMSALFQTTAISRYTMWMPRNWLGKVPMELKTFIMFLLPETLVTILYSGVFVLSTVGFESFAILYIFSVPTIILSAYSISKYYIQNGGLYHGRIAR